MRLNRIARKGRDHVFLRIDHDIDDVRELGLFDSIDHVCMDRVAIQHAHTRVFTGDESAAMVPQNSPAAADARQDALASAGKARKEMRLDEALRHQQVALGGEAVHIEAGTRGQGAQIDEIGFAERIVHCDVLLIDDLGMEPLMENITVEQIYNLLNSRLLRGHYTAISTNLSRLELKQKYTERVTSRLLDARSALAIPFMGKDIRLNKSL